MHSFGASLLRFFNVLTQSGAKGKWVEHQKDASGCLPLVKVRFGAEKHLLLPLIKRKPTKL